MSLLNHHIRRGGAVKTVCVIGAGIVGCATAYALHRQGLHITLLDAKGGPGEGASKANGAQLSYSYVEPLASPSTLRSLPSLLLSAESPVRFEPQWDWRQWQWCLRFLLACRAHRTEQGTRELLTLAQLSRSILDTWLAEGRLDITVQRNGKLVLCPTAASLTGQVRQMKFQAQLGCRQEALSREECIAREPTLAATADTFAGGIWTPDECSVDPHLMCSALTDRIRAEGACLQFNTTVHGFEQRAGKAVAARTSVGSITADAFVIAAGPQCAALAHAAGVSVPVYPVKGYSLTLPIRDASRAPTTNVTHLGIKTVFAPIGNQMRVAAMAELVGYRLEIAQYKIKRMLDAVDRLFPGACDLSQPNPWAGLRPTTPDSLPVIAPTLMGNVWVNVGHGALGLTLAAGSAARLAKGLLS